MMVTRSKNCYCHNCDKDFHYLGISRHRKAHQERGEEVTITFTYGDTYTYPAKKK